MLARLKPTCQCGMFHDAFVCDVLPSADPTGTERLRRSFGFALQIRWRKVTRMVGEAIVTRDFFGLGGSTAQSIQVIGSAGGKLVSFQTWMDGTLTQVVLNDLRIADYVTAAYGRGLTSAKRLWKVPPVGNPDNVQLLIAATRVELQGIIEAVSQRAVRAFANGLSTRGRPSIVARQIGSEIQKVGDVRSKSLASYAVVRAFNEATLDALALAGIRTVGLLPETLRVKTTTDGDLPGHPFHGNQWTTGNFGKEAGPHNYGSLKKGWSYTTSQQLTQHDKDVLYDAQVNWHDNATKAEKEASVTRQNVPLDLVRSIQFGQNDKKVAKLAEAKHYSGVVVDKIGDAYVINNGNHRVAAARQNGVTSLEMIVRELTPWVKAKKVGDMRDAPIQGFTKKFQQTAVRREKRLSKIGERVNVETAGDTKVCPRCDEIALNGPYNLDVARGLIPAHPNCRCKFIPAPNNEDPEDEE